MNIMNKCFTKILAVLIFYLFISCGQEKADFAANQNSANVIPAKTIRNDFVAGVVNDGVVTFDPDFGLISQELTQLVRPPKTQILRQIDRPIKIDSFIQGHKGASFYKNYAVSEGKNLDLLLVIDDSSSMGAEQEALSDKLEPLISSLTDVNWQIAIVTTSSSCFLQNRIIKSTDPDYNEAFKKAVMSAGINGSNIEKGIEMAIKGLKGYCSNQVTPWIRENSSVGVLIVSDEENCSTDMGPDLNEKQNCLKNPEGGKAEHLTEYLKKIAGNDGSGKPKDARVYGIFWPKGEYWCTNGFGDSQVYLDAVSQTNGVYGSICQADYTGTLQKISQNVSTIVQTKFFLQQKPDPDTLSLVMDGKKLVEGADFEKQGNLIILKSATASSKNLEISYVYGATPKHKSFDLSSPPAPETLVVKVNGQKISPSGYLLDTKEKKIDFSEEPADDAAILINYRKNVPLLEKFDLKHLGVYRDLHTVWLNDVLIKDFEFDQDEQVLRFQQTPLDNTQIKIKYQALADIVTEYAAIPSASAAETITVTDKTTNETLDFKLTEQGQLSFNIEEIRNNRKLEVDYDLGYHGNISYELPDDPMPGTLVLSARSSGRFPCKNIKLIDRKISFHCAKEDIGPVTATYRYVIDQYNRFTVKENIQESAKWKVWVDGIEITDFTVYGNTVVIPPELLLPESKVAVIVVTDEHKVER